MPIDVDRELSVSMDEAKKLKTYAREFFLGFSFPPDVVSVYKHADFLLEVVSAADALHAVEIKSNTAHAYYVAARALEEALWDFIWDIPKILKEALGGSSRHSRFRVRRRVAKEQIVFLRRDMDYGGLGIASIGLQYRALVLLINALPARRR